MDFDEVARELSGLDPDQFLAARKALVTQARATKEPALAAAIGRLRKPTRSAWLVNLLAREQPGPLGAINEVAGRLLAAHQALDLLALRSLGPERQRLIDELTGLAVAAGQARGYTATDAVRREVAQTLGAALADADTSGLVLAGRVVKAQSYSGFGLPAGLPAAQTAGAPSAGAPGDHIGNDLARPDELARRRAQAALERATAMLATARSRLRELQEAELKASVEHDASVARVAELRKLLSAAEAAEALARRSSDDASERAQVGRDAVREAEQDVQRQLKRQVGQPGD